MEKIHVRGVDLRGMAAPTRDGIPTPLPPFNMSLQLDAMHPFPAPDTSQ